MKVYSALSLDANCFLQGIYEQLPATDRPIFTSVLDKLNATPPAVIVMETVLSNMIDTELYEALEACIEEGDIDQNQLKAFHDTYPSLLSSGDCDSLLQYFEE